MDIGYVNVTIDLTPFMLFECTGDSEEGENKACSNDVVVMDSANVEDDAQSCSYDHSLICSKVCVDHGLICDYDHIREDDDVAVAVEVAEEGVDDGNWAESKVAPPSYNNGHLEKQQRRSKFCVDSKIDARNERERDRQFWEACLAS